MKKILRTAVSGLGRIAWDFHLPQLCAHDGFHPVAVVDPCRERLAEAQARFGVSALYTNFEPMLEELHPDLVVIASPTIFHADQAIRAMRAGCDVFCDKPLALSSAEAEAMFRTARETGRKLMTYQPHRLNGEARAVRAILDSGKLGPLYLIERHLSNYARRNDWQAFRKNGGGMLLNYGSHYIDQLLYLTGSRVGHVRCARFRPLSGRRMEAALLPARRAAGDEGRHRAGRRRAPLPLRADRLADRDASGTAGGPGCLLPVLLRLLRAGPRPLREGR